LFDTFSQARSEGRTHDAIDIPAAVGTPVLAASDGEIVKFYDSDKGGITIYQLSADRKYFFYYAHLLRRAEGLAEKQFVPRGTTIGYVGDTGNAGSGNYHLHFAITAAVDEKRFWEGISINPYEILTGRAELQ
jgi:murein DD-endopeptidase MepM/ murein hydrolase activator NlpD